MSCEAPAARASDELTGGSGALATPRCPRLRGVLGRRLAICAAAALTLLPGALAPVPAAAAGLRLRSFTQDFYGEGQAKEEAAIKSELASPEAYYQHNGPFDPEAGEAQAAGGHPFAVKTTLALNAEDVSAGDEAKAVEVQFPPGFLGNPQNTPKCPDAEFSTLTRCPPQSAVGFIHVPAQAGESELYNLTPPPGQVVELGFSYNGKPVAMFAHVRSSGDFGVTIRSNAIPEPTGEAIEVTLCDLGVTLVEQREAGRASYYECSKKPSPGWASPFLENPTACGQVLETALVSGWEDGERAAAMTVYQNGPSGPEADPFPPPFEPTVGAPPAEPERAAVTGCSGLGFHPSGSFAPGNAQAGQPAGDRIELDLRQPASGFLSLAEKQALTCEPGSVSFAGATTISYRWLRDGVPIYKEGSAGEEEAGPSYTLRAEDVGKAIQCEASASGHEELETAPGETSTVTVAGAAISEASDRWGALEAPLSPPTPEAGTVPTISGEPLEGRTLECDPHEGAWPEGSRHERPAFSFQWLSNGKPIAGADTSQWTVQREELVNLQCEVSASDAGGAVALVSANDPTSANPPSERTTVKAPTFTFPPMVRGGVSEAPPLSPSGLRSATVTLPEGVALSPSAADGLASCSRSQVGLLTPVGQEAARFSEAPAACPDAAKLGSAELILPVLSHPLEGSFYLAEPRENPFASLFAVYLAAYDPETGIVLKLAGKVEADGESLAPNTGTGQLTVRFPQTPQIPFESLKLAFTEGPRAPLANPRACGVYGGEDAPTFHFTPWSAQEPAQPAEVSELKTPFTISEGCIDEASFAPIVASGTETNKAATWAPFKMSFTRSDSEQQLGRLTVVTPDLVGKLAGVTRCEEPQASTGSCPESSRIGYVEVAAGPGPAPLWEPPPGSEAPIYLTGPYEGAPFGLSIPVPAEAGPLHLGKVLMRAKVNVDPHTAALTIETDPVPHILDGVPLQVRTFNVVVNRPEFVINPTDCNPLGLSARVEGLKGALESVTEHFQATGCEALPFAPSFSAQSEAKTSRQNGASLSVRISQRPGEANLKRIDIKVPTVMPTRLPTLQHSCPQAQFEANPAACPAESIVGHASARTRVLAVPLEGPAILVSHAGLHLPDVVVVLQGEGVTIEASSETHIVKGVLEEDFETIPDNPVESFEVSLPAGPHSILAANTSLCKPTEVVVKTRRVALKRHGKLVRRHGKLVYRKRKVKQRVASPLAMPTTIEGQNGHLVRQSTTIAVSGCKPAKGRKRNRGGTGKKALAKRARRSGRAGSGGAPRRGSTAQSRRAHPRGAL